MYVYLFFVFARIESFFFFLSIDVRRRSREEQYSVRPRSPCHSARNAVKAPKSDSMRTRNVRGDDRQRDAISGDYLSRIFSSESIPQRMLLTLIKPCLMSLLPGLLEDGGCRRMQPTEMLRSESVPQLTMSGWDPPESLLKAKRKTQAFRRIPDAKRDRFGCHLEQRRAVYPGWLESSVCLCLNRVC